MHTMKYSNIEFDVNIPEEQIACELESNVVELPQRTVKEHIEYALDNPIGAGDISTVVKKGDKVKANQPLGSIFSDPDDDGRTVLHFEIRREKQKLNPLEWIR